MPVRNSRAVDLFFWHAGEKLISKNRNPLSERLEATGLGFAVQEVCDIFGRLTDEYRVPPQFRRRGAG